MTIRDDIVGHALWGAANEPSIHYSQGSRRFDALDHPRQLPLFTDCSAFATLCYKWAGAPDPNGLDYNGTGYTGTLLLNLDQIAVTDALPGDLIVYGPGPGDHVVIVIEPGADPLTVSHGQEAGPIKVRHSVEVRAHRAPFRVLRGLVATPVPTPVPPPQPPGGDVKVHLWKGDHDTPDGVIHAATVYVVTEDLCSTVQAPDEHWLADAAYQLGAERILAPKGHTEIVNGVEVEIVGSDFLRPIVA